MELRNAWWTEEPNVLAVDGQKLGEPTDADADLVQLAMLDLDSAIGADNFQIDDSGKMLVSVGGSNFIVDLCQVKKADGRPDDKLVFIGLRTQAEFAPDEDEQK